MINVSATGLTLRLTPADPRWWFGGQWPVAIRHPAARLVRELIPESADTTAVCPRCDLNGRGITVLDHLLAEHDIGLQTAAEWLETVDSDLFSLAIHYLASEARK